MSDRIDSGVTIVKEVIRRRHPRVYLTQSPSNVIVLMLLDTWVWVLGMMAQAEPRDRAMLTYTQ